MGVGEVVGNLLAPRRAGTSWRHRVGIWWGQGQIAAVVAERDQARPVLFGGWPLLDATSTDTDVGLLRAVLDAAGTTPGQTQIVAALPTDWGPARRAAWHRAAEGFGIADVQTAGAAEIAAGGAPLELWSLHAVVTPDSGGGRMRAIAVIQTPTGLEVRADIAVDVRTRLAATVDDLLAAATAPGLPAVITIVGEPQATSALAGQVTDASTVVRQVTPVSLAENVLRHASAQIPAAAVSPPPPAGVLAAATVALVSVTLAVLLIGDAGAGFDDQGHPVAVFSPGHLAVAATGLSTAIVATTMLMVHWRLARRGTWDWRTAGTWLRNGAGLGLAAAGALGLLLASLHQAQARDPLAWTVLPVLPLMAAFAGIGTVVARHPEQSPTRRIWPPVTATALAATGVVALRFAEPVFIQMPTSSALAARAGLVMIAVATGIALAPRRGIAVPVAATLTVIYLLTASPSTGTLACCLFITAVTISAAAALAGISTDVHAKRDHHATWRPIRPSPAGH